MLDHNKANMRAAFRTALIRCCIVAVCLTLVLLLLLFVPIVWHRWLHASKIVVALFSAIFTGLNILFGIVRFCICRKPPKQYTLPWRMSRYLLVFLLPLFISYVANALLFYVEESPASVDAQVDSGIGYANEGASSELIVHDFHYEMDFEDALFSMYSVDQLQEHQEGFSQLILNQLVALSSTVYDENRTEYEELISHTHDFEETYLWMVKMNMFDAQDRSVRVQILKEDIDYREKANNQYEDSSNQSQIAARYADLACENFYISGVDASVESYEDAICWQLTSIRTSYAESSSTDASRVSMLEKVVFYYQQIANITKSNDTRHQKAMILAEIYQTVQKQLL